MVGAINKLFGKTWELNGATYADGVFTFPANGFAMATCSMPNPVPNHVYYGSVEQKAPSGASFPDRRFEWWKGDGAGELMVFAYMDGTNDQWVRQSAVFRAEADTSGTWIMRNFTVNGTAEAYRRNPIIIDLTEAFGAGNEPTAAWVDANMISSANGDTIFFDVPSALSEISDKRRMMMAGGGFPAEPTAYNLIGTYTSSQTWTATENGYFQIEVFGASGKGGEAYAYYDYNKYRYDGNSGGGGGGGGYACSNIKLKKGDTADIVCGVVGGTSSATINSSIENYSKITVTSGANGTDATMRNELYWGKGGAGGVASGGNVVNANGGAGSDGSHADGGRSASGGAGGAAGYTGGNAGGAGGGMNASYGATPAPGAGKAGFIKIYRGNTN